MGGLRPPYSLGGHMSKTRVLVLFPSAFGGLAPEAAAGDIVEVDDDYVAGLVAQGWAEVVEKRSYTKKTETAVTKLKNE
jgi:hypothetical protein